MKKKYLIFFPIFIACIVSLMLLSSCTNNSTQESVSENKKNDRDYELLIYNSDKNIAEEMKKLCDEYYKKTSVLVKVLTPSLEENNDVILNSYMESENPPSIYPIKNLKELKKWQNQGKVLDFSNATIESFKNIANAIPVQLRLSSNNVDNCGIPITIEGYGFFVDPKIISSLFGGEKHRAFLSDLKNCTFEEFENCAKSINSYITNGEILEFTLNSNKYSIINKKSGFSENLNGVFAIYPGNIDTISNLFNVYLCRKFNSSADVNLAQEKEINSLFSSLSELIKMLNAMTLSVSGKSGNITRGESLFDSKINNDTQALRSFANGKAVFYFAKNSIHEKLSILNSDLAKRLSFFPVKCSIFNIDDDEASQKAANKKFNTAIPIIVSNYYAINARVSEEEQKIAQNFLLWLKTSETAEQFNIQKFKYVPYDTNNPNNIDNPLSRAMFDYVKSSQILPNVVDGLPEELMPKIFEVLNDMLKIENVTFEDYQNILEKIVKFWKEMLN